MLIFRVRFQGAKTCSIYGSSTLLSGTSITEKELAETTACRDELRRQMEHMSIEESARKAITEGQERLLNLVDLSYESETIKERLNEELSSLSWAEFRKGLELPKKQALEHYNGQRHIGYQKISNERAQKPFISLAQFAKDTIGHSKYRKLVLETCGSLL